MAIRPLHDRVLVRRIEDETTTPGGIVIPDSAKEKPAQGEIIAAGNGRILDSGDVRALDVKVGDKVLFGKYAGTEVKVAGEELLVMKEDDIVGVVEETSTNLDIRQNT
jgi:chaperonin GroES